MLIQNMHQEKGKGTKKRRDKHERKRNKNPR